jgi:predicted GH43/DUF377 family glycosyl hydrolase
LQPTPLLLEDRIRMFFGVRDAEGISRVGFADLSIDDPRVVLEVSPEPVLDIGEDGCFDENGVVPSAVVAAEGLIYLYYAGYQLGRKVRFSVLGGLATSTDGGRTFSRASSVPVFERTNHERLFRVPHSVRHENGKWKAWYGGGSHFIPGADKTFPVYDIRYVESDHPDRFEKEGSIVLPTENAEYRLGRPYIFSRSASEHYMFYGYSTAEHPYRLGHAFSTDLKVWERRDAETGIEPSESGWDSAMVAYPSVISVRSGVYMFYNGREYGRDGFGVAKLVSW